jgi:hypothetical protein
VTVAQIGILSVRPLQFGDEGALLEGLREHGYVRAKTLLFTGDMLRAKTTVSSIS